MVAVAAQMKKKKKKMWNLIDLHKHLAIKTWWPMKEWQGKTNRMH